MIIEYVSQVGDERVLDIMEIDDSGNVTSATTGRGRATCEMLQRRYGAQAAATMRSWSNGYVGLREGSAQ